jgi:hypothetical protein
MKLNGTHQLLDYTGNVNLSVDSIHSSKKITEAVIDATMGVAIEINSEKAKYHHQNAGQNRNTKTANRSFQNIAKFNYSYLGVTVTNQTFIQKEIYRRLSLGSACYRFVQHHFSSRLMSKNIKMIIHRTVILHLHGILKEEHRLRVFENRVLRRMT